MWSPHSSYCWPSRRCTVAQTRIAGLIARVRLPAAAAGPVQELREAIAAFTAVKPSLAWAENVFQHLAAYYLGVGVRRGVDAAGGRSG